MSDPVSLKSGIAGIARMEFLLSLRRRGISDNVVLRAMDEVRREHYVSPAARGEAYADRALAIECGQSISQPFVVAYMTEKLAVRPGHHVLEIGTGSGYQAAVLSRLARDVVSVERYRTLAEQARARLAADGYDNVEVIVGDGTLGAADKAPYDRIMVTAAAAEIPPALVEQLAEGGVLIMPRGPADGVQHLIRVTKSQTDVATEVLIAVRFVPLTDGRAREL